MSRKIRALQVQGENKEIIVITVERTSKKKTQVHLGLKHHSLFLYDSDAFELCNRIIDELEK